MAQGTVVFALRATRLSDAKSVSCENCATRATRASYDQTVESPPRRWRTA